MTFARAGEGVSYAGAAPDLPATNPLPRRRGSPPRTRGDKDALCPPRQACVDAKTRPRSLLAGIEGSRSRQGRRRSSPGGQRSPGRWGRAGAGRPPVAGTAWGPPGRRGCPGRGWPGDGRDAEVELDLDGQGTAGTPRLSWTWAAAGRSGGHRDAAGGRDAGVALDSSLSRGTPGRKRRASVGELIRSVSAPPPPLPSFLRLRIRTTAEVIHRVCVQVAM